MTAAVAQRAAAPIQRAMGMEFETTIPVFGMSEDDYHEALYDNPSLQWKIENDGGNVEFVTRPVKTAEELIQVVGEIVRFVEAAKDLLLGTREPVAIAEICKAAGFELTGACSGRIGGGPLTADMFDAKPQATFGIPLERVANLMRDARNHELVEYQQQREASRSTSDHASNSNDAPDAATDAHGPDTLLADETSPEFERPAAIDSLAAAVAWGERMEAEHPEAKDVQRAVGLMALVLRYLNDGRYKSGGPPDYVKAYFPVMARTDFVSMYQQLGDAQPLFTVQAVLACWGAEPRIARETRVLSQGFADTAKASVHRGAGPTIWDWLVSIAGEDGEKEKLNGRYRKEDDELDEHYKNDANAEFRVGTRTARHKDLLSRGAVALNSTSMGLKGMDREGGQDLTLLEFRQFPSDAALQPSYWESLAGHLFALYDGARHDDHDVSLGQVNWSRDVIGGIRVNIDRQTEALRDAADDTFNARVQKLRDAFQARLDQLDASDRKAVQRFLKGYGAAIRNFQAEHGSLTKTRAPAVPAERSFPVAEHPEVTPGEAARRCLLLVNRYFEALRLDTSLDAVDRFHDDMVRWLRELKESRPQDYNDFLDDTASKIAEFENKATDHRQHGEFPEVDDDFEKHNQRCAREGDDRHKQALAELAGVDAVWKYAREKLKAAVIQREDATVSDKKTAAALNQRIAEAEARYHDRLLSVSAWDQLPGILHAFVADYTELRGAFISLEPKFAARRPPPMEELTHDLPGNCLFNSVSHVLGGAPSPAELRRMTAEQVRMYPFSYIDKLVGGNDDVMVAIADAAAFLQIDGNWNASAGEIAPLALGDVLANLGRQLVILNPDGSIRTAVGATAAPVFVYYGGDHYQPGGAG